MKKIHNPHHRLAFGVTGIISLAGLIFGVISTTSALPTTNGNNNAPSPQNATEAANPKLRESFIVRTTQPSEVARLARGEGLKVLRSTKLPGNNSLVIMDGKVSDTKAKRLNQKAKNIIIGDAAPNQTYQLAVTPNDTYYTDQWNMPKISAPKAWDLTKGSSAVKIAVLDTGVLSSQQWEGQGPYAHPDFPTSKIWTNTGEQGSTTQEGPTPNCTSRGLALNKSCNNIDDDNNGQIDDWRGWDFMGGWRGGSTTCPNHNDPTTYADPEYPDYITADNDPQPYSCDDYTNTSQLNKTHYDGGCGFGIGACYIGHGTSVGSVAAGATNNSQYTAGVDWNAQVMNLRVMDGYGYGSSAHVTAAIEYAITMKADVINMSLALFTDGSCTTTDTIVEDALSRAKAAGIVTVAASGNGGGSGVCYPARSSHVIAVGSSDQNDKRSSFSTYGPELDVIAPGTSIPAANAPSKARNSNYHPGASGTSLATPHVAGLAGLLRAVNPQLSPSSIYRVITEGADKVADMDGKKHTDQHGFGRLNAFTTLQSFKARFKAQAAYPTIKPGASAEVHLSYHNDGTAVWYDDYALANNLAPSGSKPVRLATAQPINRSSIFSHTWNSKNRATGLFSVVYKADGTAYTTNPHAVQPGESVKFVFKLTAQYSQKDGVFREYFQPILDGTSDGAFNRISTFLDVSVTKSNFATSFKAQSSYPALHQNTQTKRFITYKNTGNIAWYDNTGVTYADAPAGVKPTRLATTRITNRTSEFGGEWGGKANRATATFATVYDTNGVPYAENPHIVLPGESAQFEFTITAPDDKTPGVYREYFAPVVEGIGLLKVTSFLDITVKDSIFTAEFKGQSPYPTALPGETISAFFRYRNAGNVAWYDSASKPKGVKPVVYAAASPVNRISDFNRLFATHNRPAISFGAVYNSDGTLASDQSIVYPNQTVEFIFDLSVPSTYTPGEYREWFRPILEGAHSWNMGGGSFLDVTVN